MQNRRIVKTMVTVGMFCVATLSMGAVQCVPAGTCQCRRFRVQTVDFLNYNFLMSSPTTVDVLASIQCRSRDASGQSTISFEVSLDGDVSGRNMEQGSNQILFNVYHPNAPGVVLGQGSNAYTYTGVIGSSYNTIPLTFPAEIFTNQNVVDGVYQRRYQFHAVHTQFNNTRTRNRSVRFRVRVNRVCEVSANDVNLGTYYATNSSPATATGTLMFKCTPNVSAAFSVNPGTGSSSYASRVLSSGTNTLPYNVYTDPAYSAIWGDGSGGSQTISLLTSGSAQSSNYYVRIPAGQFSPAGLYTSTLVMTLLL